MRSPIRPTYFNKQIMKLFFIFLFLIYFIFLLSLAIVKANTSHGVLGMVLDSCDGTKANGANVTFYITARPDEVLHDTVGPSGECGENNCYFVDVGNFPTQWNVGDQLVINIFKDQNHSVTTSVTLTASGFDIAPTVSLPGGECSNNIAPSIQSYYPTNLSLQIHNPVLFWVYARDSDNDQLMAVWYLDNNQEKVELGTGIINTSYLFSQETGNHSLLLTISDGRKNISMVWNINIVNHAPKIYYYYPEQKNIKGESPIVLFISARDEDNDEITLKWYVNNEEVETSNAVGEINKSFEFSSSKGTYTIKAEVSDGMEKDYVSWNVILNQDTCIDYWECNEWGNCSSDGYRYRQCWKVNPECQSNSNKPPTKLYSPECLNLNCTPKYVCGDWGECKATFNLENIIGQEGASSFIEGKMYSECVDVNNCTNIKKVYEKSCVLFVPIETKVKKQCQTAFYYIKDLITNETVLKIKKPTLFTGLDIFFFPNETTNYCWYCFDGVKNFDETGVDCGGPNCPPCSAKNVFFNLRLKGRYKTLLLFLFIISLTAFILSLIRDRVENLNPVTIFEKVINGK